MELTFLGTRGETKIRSRLHGRHSSLLVQHGDVRIMIDCGADWRHRLRAIAPSAIVLTHAHNDHAAGLVSGAPCPVYATAGTWRVIRHLPILDRRTMPLRKAMQIGGVRFSAFPVMHSLRAPAVGYRVSSQRRCFVYLPDVAELPNPSRALRRIDLYIGDGATIKRSTVRRRGGAAVGHAPIIHQLDWCSKAHVRRVVFTHCGSPIVRADARDIAWLICRLGRARGVSARIACDGDSLSLRPVTRRRSGN